MNSDTKRLFEIVDKKLTSERDKTVIREAIIKWMKSTDPLFIEETLLRTSCLDDVREYCQRVEGLLNLGIGLPFNDPEYQLVLWMIESGYCNKSDPEREYTSDEYTQVATEAYALFNHYQEAKKQKTNKRTLYYILR